MSFAQSVKKNQPLLIFIGPIYNSYDTIVLMAIAVANSNCAIISRGDFERNSDGPVFRNSKIGKLLHENKLSIQQYIKFLVVSHFDEKY